MGRLVQNHSTHILGLIKWLKKIAENINIKTVTPGVISKTNGRGEKLANQNNGHPKVVQELKISPRERMMKYLK